MLIGDTVNKETNIVNQQKLVKHPNWQESDQLAIYKAFFSSTLFCSFEKVRERCTTFYGTYIRDGMFSFFSINLK